VEVKMDSKPRISEAEWTVMKVLWYSSPLTANEVVDALSGKRAWKPKTVRTLLNRLVSKKALKFDKKGREYLYRPAVSESVCIKAETKSFLSRSGAGALKPVLAAFLEEEQLSEEDIAELKRLLEEKGGKE
jgi:BlaI family penicillinase repressor